MEKSQPEALARWQQRLLEIIDAQWDRFVDPADAVFDDDGLRWGVLGATPGMGLGAGLAFATEAQLREIRGQCRELAVSNEFAINGHENRINYIVGTGHSYRVTAGSGDCGPDLVRQTQAVIDVFLRENRWHKRQQEIIRRKDRDGECFLRFFDARDGSVRVRFVEPEQVTTPPQAVDDRAASFGILTDPADVETVRGYFVDGKLVRADEIQHRKENVDANVKRGIPLFFPVRKNLRRAEKLLRNMSVVAEIQSAIAIIRKHASGTRSALEQFAQEGADVYQPRPGAPQSGYFRRYGPGTILDVLSDTDYQFPASGLDAGRYVTVLQAELRAIASRLVMPEFMLTSDASNANYSSTMVAEGPAMRMFDRMQQDMIEDDLAVMAHVVQAAADAGRLPPDVLERVAIQAVAPTLAVRDRLQDAQADQILVKNQAMSVETMAARHGLSPDHEQRLIARRASVRESNFDPEEPRDERGRWTTGGRFTDPTDGGGGGSSDDDRRKKERQEREKINQALAPKAPVTPGVPTADANSLLAPLSGLFSDHKFTSADGKHHFVGRFAGFDAQGRVLIQKVGEVDAQGRVVPLKEPGGTFVPGPEGYSADDQKFLGDLAKVPPALANDPGFAAGIRAKPDNLHIDSSGVPGGEEKRRVWEAQVIRDIGKLGELDTGKAILDGAKQQGKDITIQHRPRDKDDSASGGNVYYEPGDRQGARARSGKERPPFIGLGQELYNAEANLSRGSLDTHIDRRETAGLETSSQLRREYNKAMDDPGRRQELQQRYPEPEPATGYPGWGSKKVDEDVLGLDHRPVRRRGSGEGD